MKKSIRASYQLALTPLADVKYNVVFTDPCSFVQYRMIGYCPSLKRFEALRCDNDEHIMMKNHLVYVSEANL